MTSSISQQEENMLRKEEVLDELKVFLVSYADSISRIYGAALPMPEELDPTASTLWQTVVRAYEYGVEGKQVSHFLGTPDVTVDPEVSDADSFFHALSSDYMGNFLSEDGVGFPRKCERVINMAIARHVLYGGLRDLSWEASGFEEGGYLSIGEVALLADMDERSVRNAAANKGEGRLMTEQVGKRSLVEIGEAKRWLAGRKGFVPSVGTEAAPVPPSMSAATMQSLVEGAAAAGLSLDEFVQKRLLAA
jgi:hypothetical protein